MMDKPNAESGDGETRLRRLVKHYLVDAVAGGRLRETVELAATTIGFPHAEVNMLDDTFQYTISDYRAGGTTVTPRADSMCNFTVSSDGVLAVGDMRVDPRSRDLPGVRTGRAASYLGVALRGRESIRVGTLCFFDSEPRAITDEQIERTKQFGEIIEDQLDLLRRGREQPLLDRISSADLARAIDRSEIVPWFAPIVDLQSERVVGYEALAQWERGDGEGEDLLQANPFTEDSDLIIDLRVAVMRRALDEYARWDRPDLRLNLNVPTRQLALPEAVAAVHDGVLASGVDPRLVDLEIGDSPGSTDPTAASEAVQLLRSYGYRVLLDGYGAGWSSLAWVLGLPINGIKLDRAVTAALGTPAGDAVSRALLTLTGDLNLHVIIDGIGTTTQAQLAGRLGYRYGQGGLWTDERVPSLPLNG